MKPFTQNDARKIADKLGATMENRSKHDFAVVKHNGKIIAKYGITRASKEKNHGHIPGQLGISSSEVRKLADCSISKAGYFSLRERNGTSR